MYLIPPKRICLSGGGIRAVAFLGALEALNVKGLLRSVKEYVGVSAGAFIAFGFCIGYTLSEMKQIGFAFDFSKIRNLEAESAIEFLEQYGLDDGEMLKKLLESLLKQKQLPPGLTFAGLAEMKPKEPRLRCFATDLTTCLPREFSLEATPSVSIVEALRATMSLPFYFTPVPDPITGHLLSDGALLDNYPMSFLNPNEQSESLGLIFSNTHVENRQINEPWDFLQQILACVYLPRVRRILDICSNNTIILPNGDYPSYHFEATMEERKELAKEAKKATLRFIDKWSPSALPIRRYSVS